ncbi:phage portal protein [uncultured Friedmanniella sp.]|uniref:phage portal protein n=1 Tax=uncultured Friedmanniella sp. TaxID=335381 RepID=UPI0035CA05BC
MTWIEERARARGESVQSRSVTSQLWPPPTEPRTLTRQVWDETSAASIPSVAKALHVHQLIGLMDLDCYRGVKPMARRPRLLEQPDLTTPGSTWFIQQHVTDWLLSGNACHLVTVRDAEGQPAATRWRPAHQWSILQDGVGEIVGYQLNGVDVRREDVVHVRRGHQPGAQGRGVGIVEQHLRTLDRAGLEEETERQNLRGGSVPSVAVIAPNKNLDQKDADDAADAWEAKLGGPRRRPAILPNGTQVIPLTWSASDQQLIEARKMTLQDVANLTGLDGYWLGAPSGTLTYKSPGPMWLALLRITLEPMLRLFEDAWSQAWLPRGRTVRFNRLQLTRDDLQTSIATMAAGRAAGLVTYEEARVYLGSDPDVPEPETSAAAAPPAADDTDPADDEQSNDQGDEPGQDQA